MGHGIRDRWIDVLHRAATGTRRTRTLLTPVGATVFTLFAAFFVVAAVLVDNALGLPGLLREAVRPWVAMPLIALGVAVAAWSGLHFLRVKGTPVPFNPPPRLVATGPYRRARNPMLTGIFLLLFGLGFLFGSVSLVFVFTPLFVLVNVWELRNIEEPELEKRLGDEYLDYRARTPMFVPWLRSRDR
jgi:protein-S-isoprenylcysteine O-methyltransferase Ste14